MYVYQCLVSRKDGRKGGRKEGKEMKGRKE
jgi:hypothetical protein